MTKAQKGLRKGRPWLVAVGTTLTAAVYLHAPAIMAVLHALPTPKRW